jgi:ubiquinol-cytochrome c reductase cytochrome c1 subunit
MTRKALLGALAALILAADPASAASPTAKPAKQSWSFDGVFGSFDRASLRRGFMVYKEVCSSCHAMKQLAYRHLADVGFDENEVKAIAATVEVQDGPNDAGEMFARKGIPSDKFKSPFPNEKAARAANNGAYPPDLSLIVKARKGGADYIHALLTGYKDPPANVKVPDGMYYNAYFPGAQLAMAPPLNEGAVTYPDGTKASVDQMAKDTVMFLAWAAEPELEARKRMGLKVLLFLIVLTGMLYALKRMIWADVH